MKPLHFALLLATLSTACQKDGPEDGILPEIACGADGARIEATIGGEDWCANASVIANGSDATVIITGISMSTGTLMLQIDSIGMGAQPITEAGNSLLYTGTEGSYTVAQGEQGTLTITALDMAAHTAKGTAEVDLRLNGEGAVKSVHASFEVTWSGD